jgi:hypothetical protein
MKYFPLYYPNCKQETLIDVQKFQVKVISKALSKFDKSIG